MEKNKKNTKGIILAGGTATRLFPLTATTSKQLLPVYDRQMIFYPLNTLIKAGIKEILIIVSPEHSGQFLNLLGLIFEKTGIHLEFAVQSVPRGLADAFMVGEEFIDDDNVAMILGDNIFEDDISQSIKNFKEGGLVFVKEVPDPERFGVAEFDENGKVISIEEKPQNPKSNCSITGAYVYDSKVIEFAKSLRASDRGEIEITDINKEYLKIGELKVEKISGEWLDAGTFDSLLEAGKIVKEKGISRNFDLRVEKAIEEFNKNLKILAKKKIIVKLNCNLHENKKAIVAVAGSGTRLLPATKSMPKEMLPIVDKPIIQLVVEELVEAGIKDIILVTKWDKKPLEDHFDHSWALENDLEKAGKLDYLKEIQRIAGMANYIYVRQAPQYGNGVPVLSAASLIKNEPFVFVWGDDLVKSKISFTKQMIQDYEKNERLMIGVQEVPRDQVNRYGIVDIDEKSKKLKGIIEKPSIEEAPSQLADFGRMILNQDIVDILKKTPLGKGNELWIVDAITEYVKQGGDFYVKEVEDGEWLTTGDPLNYIKAFLKYAVERDDIGEDVRKLLNDLK